MLNNLIIILSQPSADIVKDLPDYSYKGLLYSGYLEVNSNTYYHYMFVQAHEDPENKPLVLWLNGGPGCSSMDGWAEEHGPMTLGNDGKFKLNPYSWNKAANMLYLESPGDVGFSYIDSKLDYELFINDEVAASNNLKALISFFKLFPSLKNKDFYISGESYAGIYVPMTAYKILKFNEDKAFTQKIKLKGILVGNGVADWNYDVTNAKIDFAFTHHFYSYVIRKEYNELCLSPKTYDPMKCNDLYEKKISPLIDGINVYDYLQDCYIPTTEDGEIDTKSAYFRRYPYAFKNYKKLIKNQANKTSKFNVLSYLKDELNEKLEGVVPCVDDSHIYAYLNRDDVKQALHMTYNYNRKWELCNLDVLNRYQQDLEKGSIWTYPYLIKSGIRILIYNGDTDLAVPFNGNQKWIQNLVRQENLETVTPWQQWWAFNNYRSVAGYYIEYKGLTFCTIKGTGHMAPQWKPAESFYMFEKFLKGEKF